MQDTGGVDGCGAGCRRCDVCGAGDVMGVVQGTGGVCVVQGT